MKNILFLYLAFLCASGLQSMDDRRTLNLLNLSSKNNPFFISTNGTKLQIANDQGRLYASTEDNDLFLTRWLKQHSIEQVEPKPTTPASLPKKTSKKRKHLDPPLADPSRKRQRISPNQQISHLTTIVLDSQKQYKQATQQLKDLIATTIKTASKEGMKFSIQKTYFKTVNKFKKYRKPVNVISKATNQETLDHFFKTQLAGQLKYIGRSWCSKSWSRTSRPRGAETNEHIKLQKSVMLKSLTPELRKQVWKDEIKAVIKAFKKNQQSYPWLVFDDQRTQVTTSQKDAKIKLYFALSIQERRKQFRVQVATKLDPAVKTLVKKCTQLKAQCEQ